MKFVLLLGKTLIYDYIIMHAIKPSQYALRQHGRLCPKPSQRRQRVDDEAIKVYYCVKL